jgi:hypothetical protein
MNNFAPLFATLAVLAVFASGLSIGHMLGKADMVSHKEAIQHGAAHYDPVTAKFTWNSSATTPTLNPEAPKAPKP